MTVVAAATALLDAYLPSPGDEAVIAEFAELLETERPAARAQFTPGHLTASGFVLSPDRSALLLIHHRRLRRWLQPGGHIDEGDPAPLAAARREVDEETGVADLTELVAGLIGLNRHPIPERHDEPAHHHFDLQFAFIASSWHLEQRVEVIEARWVPLGEVPALAGDAAVQRALMRLSALP